MEAPQFVTDFAEKHPKAAQWIREGGLFLLFSYFVTFLKWLLLSIILPPIFSSLVGQAEFLWPNIPLSFFGLFDFNLSIIGNELVADQFSGLAFTLANFTTIFIGEAINFPLQRNITFKSKGPVIPQIICHFAATFIVFIVMNIFTCIWNPLTNYFGIPLEIANIVTTVVTGGVALVIIFAVDKTIFSPKFMNPDYVEETVEDAVANAEDAAEAVADAAAAIDEIV